MQKNEITDLEDTNYPIRIAKRIFLNVKSLRDPWDNIKYTSISNIGASEGEKREKGQKNLFEEIMTKNFPNLGKDTDTKV